MKKSIILALVSLVSILGFVGCKDITTEGLTGITYYASITLEGDEVCYLDMNSTYEEPGYSSVLNGEDNTADVVVSTDLDMTKAGIYTVSYSFTNADGFSSSAIRTIYVSAPNGVLTPNGCAYYSVLDGTYRDYAGSKTPFSGQSIFIQHLGDGVYNVSCFIGGYYDQYIGYGSGYAMAGSFKLHADNTIEVLSAGVPSWGDTMDSYTNAKYDPATGVLSWEIAYAGIMTFYVYMSL